MPNLYALVSDTEEPRKVRFADYLGQINRTIGWPFLGLLACRHIFRAAFLWRWLRSYKASSRGQLPSVWSSFFFPKKLRMSCRRWWCVRNRSYAKTRRWRLLLFQDEDFKNITFGMLNCLALRRLCLSLACQIYQDIVNDRSKNSPRDYCARDNLLQIISEHETACPGYITRFNYISIMFNCCDHGIRSHQIGSLMWASFIKADRQRHFVYSFAEQQPQSQPKVIAWDTLLTQAKSLFLGLESAVKAAMHSVH